MARATLPESSLAQNAQVSDGLQQFRSFAEGTRDQRDSPFGPPPKAEETAASAAPKFETVRIGPRPPSRSAREGRKAHPIEEEAGADAEANQFVENVTVPLSEALRDRSEELARAINRNRSVRKQRITRNSIIRVALQCFLDSFTAGSDLNVNSEDELLEVARSRSSRLSRTPG